MDQLEKKFQITVQKWVYKCDESERQIISEYYQRCFGEEISNETNDFNLV